MSARRAGFMKRRGHSKPANRAKRPAGLLVAPPSNPQSWPRQTAFSDGGSGLGLVNAAAAHVGLMPVEGGNMARVWFARNWNDA